MTVQPPVIVVAYDGSTAARQAIAHAAALAPNGRVVVVHARESSPLPMASHWRELHETDAAGARDVLERIVMADNAGLTDRDWEARLVDGRPAQAVLRVAGEVGADVIVVGADGHGDGDGLLGSVCTEILRASEVPVTVIPTRCTARHRVARGRAVAAEGARHD